MLTLDFLNDYPVLAKAPWKGRISGDYAVLVRRNDNSLHPYVVAHWNKDAKKNWNWGNYFGTYDEALKCFFDKCTLPAEFNFNTGNFWPDHPKHKTHS